MAEVSRLQGIVEVLGADPSVQALLRVSKAFDDVAVASTNAQKQAAAFSTVAQATQTAANGVQNLVAANQRLNQSQAQQARDAAQIAALEERASLTQKTRAERVDFLRQKLDGLTAGTVAYARAQLQLAQAEQAVAREEQSRLQSLASGAGRGVLEGAGVGGILGGLGIAGGAALLTRGLIQVGQQSAELARTAETIGTAYEHSAQRAGVASDDLLGKLRAAARGTVEDAQLQQSATEAFALGVGKNADQIASLLAIARQRGKDFGLDTQEAFRQLVEGIGRASPEILNNLGIIVNGKQVYGDYAKAIGTTADKLTDQQKSQAIVNDLIEKNTDLINENATAELSSADKYAQAQARRDEALTHLGRAAVPAETAGANVVASFLEGFDVQAGASEAAQIQKQLRDTAASYADYVNAINAKRQELIGKPSFFGDLGTALGLTGGAHDARVAEQLSAVDELTYKLDKQADAHERSAAAATANARALDALKASADTALDDAQIKRWGDALSIETDRVLRPYKGAVDAAKDSLDAHKTSTAAAKDEVDHISGALSTAKSRFQEFASAQLVGTKAYTDALFGLDQQQARVQKSLLLFQAPGGGLDQQLAPIQQQIDATSASVDTLAHQVDSAQDAVQHQQRVVDDASASLQQHEQAVTAAKTAYDSLKQTISDNTSELERLRSASLTGTGAFESQLDGLNDRANALQLRLTNMKLSGAPESSLKALEAQIQRVNLQSQRTKLQENLALDPLRRQIQDFGKAGDLTFDQIIDGMRAAQGNIDTARQQLGPAAQALKDQTAARDAAKAAVDREKDSLDTLNRSLQDVRDTYDQQKQRLSDLKTQLDTVRTQALKPFQDQIDALGRRAEVLNLSEKLELDPLRKKIEETAKPIREMTFKEIIDGLNTTNGEIDTLTGKLGTAQAVLQKEEDATKEAQAHYDAAKTALDQQQKYFDNLKQGLDDLKTKLTESKNIWGDLSTLIGAINAANASGMGTNSAYNGQPTGGTAGGTYNAQAINSVIPAASPLSGQGQFIIQMALKYGIPVEIALAMWQVEGQYATAGATVGFNNPGNLRSSALEAGERGGFAYFSTIQQGIEAYFKQLREGSQFGYPQAVDRYKGGDISALLDLIKAYAPASDKNDPQAYYESVKRLILSLLQQIRGGRMTTATGTIGNATTADDPRPDAGALRSLFGPTAHLGETYDATRPGTTGTHQGLDIQITPNTPFGAPVALHITAVYPDQFFVNTTVQGTDMYGRQWLFAHLIRVPVKIGDHVPKGGVLGYVAANAGHVHVQLRQRNDTSTPIDPSQALNDAATGYGAQSLATDTGGGGADRFSSNPVGGYTMLQSGAAGSNPLADAQAVFAFVQVGIETLGQLKRYHGVSREAVQLFSNDVAGFVATFTAAVAGFDRDAMGAALQWVTTSGAVLSSVGTGIDDLTAISRYKGVSRNAVLQFGNDLYATVETLTTIVRDFDRAGMAAAVTWQESAGQVLAIVGAGVDSLTAISKYKGVSPKTVWDFAHDVKEFVWGLTSIEKDFDPDAVQAAADWATNAGTVLTTLSTALDSFKQLGKYKGVTQAQVWTLEHDIKESVFAIVTIANDMDPDAVQAAATFAATSGQVLTVFGGAIDAFTKLADYKGVAPEAVHQIENDITGAVGLMTVLAQKLDKEGVQAAADFADSAGRVIAPIGAAVDTFTKLKDYKGVLPDAVRQIESDITGAVATMIEMDRMLDEDGLQAATDVAAKEQTIFEALGAGLSFFTNVEDYKGKGPEKVQALLDDIAHVNEMTGALSYQAGAAESGANDFEGHLQSYASHIRSALNSIRALDGLRADATIHAATHVVTDGAGGGTGGNANGGNGNNPDVPDLGYQPPSNSSGSGMASGGPVAAGVSYMVGEFGRELFTPMTNGYITPHNEVSSGDTHLHFDFTGTNFGGATPAQIEYIVTGVVEAALAQRDAGHLSIGRSKGR